MNTSTLYPLLFDAIRDPLLVVDKTGAIVLANSAAHDFFRFEGPRAVAGLTCRDVRCDFDANEVMELLEAGEVVTGHRLHGQSGAGSKVALDLESVPGADGAYWLLRSRQRRAARL